VEDDRAGWFHHGAENISGSVFDRRERGRDLLHPESKNNLGMWMVILILLHAAALLLITILEI
jgi:hypothetical protein